MGVGKLTPQSTTLLQMIHPFSAITLPQFLPDKARHHAAHPLLADDGVAGVVEGDVVFEVDAVVGGCDGGLFGEEGCGLGGWHCGWFGFGWDSLEGREVIGIDWRIG